MVRFQLLDGIARGKNMAAKTYWLKFGSVNPQAFTGLSPTFAIFETSAGSTTAPPGITESIAGTGLYSFSYTQSPTFSIAFLVDGDPAGVTLIPTDRYITGVLDPVQAVDQGIATLQAYAVTSQISVLDISTRIGTTASSFGSTLVDPGDMFGYLKRNLEFEEGNATFNKSTGEWDILSRGSSTLLRVKGVVNSSGSVAKT